MRRIVQQEVLLSELGYLNGSRKMIIRYVFIVNTAVARTSVGQWTFFLDIGGKCD